LSCLVTVRPDELKHGLNAGRLRLPGRLARLIDPLKLFCPLLSYPWRMSGTGVFSHFINTE